MISKATACESGFDDSWVAPNSTGHTLERKNKGENSNELVESWSLVDDIDKEPNPEKEKLGDLIYGMFSEEDSDSVEDIREVRRTL